MNFSHGSYEYHQSVIDNARAAEKSQAGRPVAIALDTVSTLPADGSTSLITIRKDLRFVPEIHLEMQTSQSLVVRN